MQPLPPHEKPKHVLKMQGRIQGGAPPPSELMRCVTYIFGPAKFQEDEHAKISVHFVINNLLTKLDIYQNAIKCLYVDVLVLLLNGTIKINVKTHEHS